MNNNIRFWMLGLLCLMFSSFAFAQSEYIRNFDVTIQINKDRSIKITEDITYVKDDIRKRGIVRRLPLVRQLKGNKSVIKYDITGVKKNGLDEPHHTKKSGQFKQLYVGESNVFLDAGEYRYTLEYTAANQIAMYENYDMLYWNAIGHDWDFPINKGSCTIILPDGARVVNHTLNTGAYGKTEINASYEERNGGKEVFFQLTKPLAPREGLTTGVSFEKGFVEEAGFLERFGATLPVGIGGFVLMLYLVFSWRKYGVDPPKPAIYPSFNSPNNLSPASLNYILKEKYQTKSITSSIIHLAVQGYIRIEEQQKRGIFGRRKVYDLIHLKKETDDLPKEERLLMRNLFSGTSIVNIDGTYHANVEKAASGHQGAMDGQHSSFVNEGNNQILLLAPIILMIIAIVLSVLFLLPTGESLENFGPNMTAISVFLLVGTFFTLIYARLIKRPSEKKLALQSEIEGFKLYLEMAEKDRLNLLNPPERTPEHFEAMLPFAFALGVEHVWSSKFKNILDNASYQPDWSTGTMIYFGDTNFSNNFGNSLLSSSSPPVESSGGGWSGGSSGGGFSGGGGGGGGGGSW